MLAVLFCNYADACNLYSSPLSHKSTRLNMYNGCVTENDMTCIQSVLHKCYADSTLDDGTG